MTISATRRLVTLSILLLCSLGCSRSGDAIGPTADPDAAADIRSALFGEADAETDAAGETADNAEATAASTGSGWATLRGRFLFDGTPPKLPALTANKDTAVCAPGGQGPPDDSFVCEGTNGGIANVAVYLRDAPRVHDSAEPGETPIEFDQKNCIFLTHVAPVVVGETLLIKNSDSVGHNTNIGVVKGTAFNSIIPANHPGMEYKPTKEEALPAEVGCNIHPWMRAYLLPRENRYVDATADDGTFEIANLPAGVELEFQVWHERAATGNRALVVDSAAAKALNWSKRGRFTVTLAEGQTEEIEIVVPARAFRL